MSSRSAEENSRLRELLDQFFDELDGLHPVDLWEALGPKPSEESDKSSRALRTEICNKTLVARSTGHSGVKVPHERCGPMSNSRLPVPTAKHNVNCADVNPALAHASVQEFQAQRRSQANTPSDTTAKKRRLEQGAASAESIKRSNLTGNTSREDTRSTEADATSLPGGVHNALHKGPAALAQPNARTKEQHTDSGEKQLQTLHILDDAHRRPPRLPRQPCAFTGQGTRQQNGRTFQLKMRITVDKVTYNGVCSVHTCELRPSSLQLLQRGDLLEEDLRLCEARLVAIEDEDEEDFVVHTKVYWRDIALSGTTWIPKTDIDLQLLNHYDVIIGNRLPVQESVEELGDREARVEGANKRIRTVVILGQLPIGERKRWDVNVEVWSWDGQASMEFRAKITERKESAGGFHVGLRVRLAEKRHVHLRGWMHADMFSGRFAEEFPGETFVD